MVTFYFEGLQVRRFVVDLQQFLSGIIPTAFINILLGGAIRLRLYPLNLMRLVPP